jgi:hypothetical protein
MAIVTETLRKQIASELRTLSPLAGEIRCGLYVRLTNRRETGRSKSGASGIALPLECILHAGETAQGLALYTSRISHIVTR